MDATPKPLHAALICAMSQQTTLDRKAPGQDIVVPGGTWAGEQGQVMQTETRNDPAPGDGDTPAASRLAAAASKVTVGDVATTQGAVPDGAGTDAVARAWLRRQMLPSLALMMVRGATSRCPVCGEGRLFQGYVRLVPQCGACGAPLAAVRADDAPPYFTIFITAHIIIALVVLTTHDSALPVWSMILGFVPLTLVIALLLLRPVKGAVVGVMLKLGLIGEHRDGSGT